MSVKNFNLRNYFVFHEIVFFLPNVSKGKYYQGEINSGVKFEIYITK